MSTIRDFSVEKHSNNQKIIIYGAAVYGELCLRGLEVCGLEVYAFADRRTDLSEYLGIKVIKPEDIKGVDNAVVLIASVNYIKQIVDFFKEEEINNFYHISSILKMQVDDARLSYQAKDVRKNCCEYDEKIADYEKSDFSINNIDLVLTQVCNLKCKDCGSLIPLYKRPCHFEMEQITRYFDRFLQAVDSVKELRLLGGETFLYPNLVELVKYYLENEKIKKIVIYTNGVIESTEQVMQQHIDKKIVIRISNYRTLSKNIEKVATNCKALNIECETLDSLIWRDMGGLERRDYSFEQCCNVYERCDNAKCPSFCKGKLYICPRAAHGQELGLFENGKDDYIDFTLDDINYSSYKEKVESLLYKRNHFEACYYCNGNNRWENPIPAAIQVKKD